MKNNYFTFSFMLKKTTPKKRTTTLFSAGILLMSSAIFTGCQKQGAVTPAKTSTAAANQQTELVSTPFGRVPASKVHTVEQGAEIAVIDGNIKKINSSTGAVLADYGSATPTTKATNSVAKGPITQSLAAKSSGTISGVDYYAYGEVPSGKSVKSFSTSWVVPNNPVAGADTTQFLWNGMMSDDGNTFMQPVLQWNQGQGHVWTLANWGALNGNYFNSSFSSPIAAGTTVTGVMTLVSAKSGAYKYSIAFTGHSSITYTQTYTEPVNQVIEDFEPYVNSYTGFPTSQYAEMQSINLQYTGSSTNQPITWILGTDGGYFPTPSSNNTVVYNNGTNHSTVYFYFR